MVIGGVHAERGVRGGTIVVYDRVFLELLVFLVVVLLFWTLPILRVTVSDDPTPRHVHVVVDEALALEEVLTALLLVLLLLLLLAL